MACDETNTPKPDPAPLPRIYEIHWQEGMVFTFDSVEAAREAGFVLLEE